MSKVKRNSVYNSRNNYHDRVQQSNTFGELSIKIYTLDTALLLLSSEEESVLVAVFKHISEYALKQDENIALIKEKNMLDLLLAKKFFMANESVIVKRFALHITSMLIETTNTLIDLSTDKTCQIIYFCVRLYMTENDDFLIEYLSVIVNKCLDDPQVARLILSKREYFEKFFQVLQKAESPDIVLHSIEAIQKMLQVQSTELMQKFVEDVDFPIDRIICELANEFQEIRSATLKVIKTLIVNCSETSPFAQNRRAVSVLQQLTEVLCEDATNELAGQVTETLALSMRNENMSKLFFERNLFGKIGQNMQANADKYSMTMKCKIVSIFVENAKYLPFLQRLYEANVTDDLLDCLLHSEPSTHVVTGLIRMMKHSQAAASIVAAYEDGLITKLLKLIQPGQISIKTREQAAELLCCLLQHSFQVTATILMEMVTELSIDLGEIFGQSPDKLSIDFILSLLNIIERLAQKNEYRSSLGHSKMLIVNIGLLLKDSFATAILVSNIFRCLCTLVDEEYVRSKLIQTYIMASIKRGLKLLANLVKTSVTNFIMQTTRFPEFVNEYIKAGGVLEVLLLNQKHSFGISTWSPAIESILSKSPTLKFCIRNHLSFTDSTVGQDFLVSKRKFDDFRIFQTIIKEEVSPLDTIFVVTFNRIRAPSEMIVSVPSNCFSAEELLRLLPSGGSIAWCYCRKPGDEHLPQMLDNLNKELEVQGLVENPLKMPHSIDFDNVAKRAKLIAVMVACRLSENLKSLDLNCLDECSEHTVKCHLRELTSEFHTNFIPLGRVRSGCQFERAVLFKCLADQIGLPCTLQRSVDGRMLFNELPLPVVNEHDIHCEKDTLKFMPWCMLRPTHIVDLMFNVGELYPMQSRQALQYLRLY